MYSRQFYPIYLTSCIRHLSRLTRPHGLPTPRRRQGGVIPDAWSPVHSKMEGFDHKVLIDAAVGVNDQ